MIVVIQIGMQLLYGIDMFVMGILFQQSKSAIALVLSMTPYQENQIEFLKYSHLYYHHK